MGYVVAKQSNDVGKLTLSDESLTLTCCNDKVNVNSCTELQTAIRISSRRQKSLNRLMRQDTIAKAGRAGCGLAKESADRVCLKPRRKLFSH